VLFYIIRFHESPRWLRKVLIMYNMYDIPLGYSITVNPICDTVMLSYVRLHSKFLVNQLYQYMFKQVLKLWLDQFYANLALHSPCLTIPPPM
jgi:antibiotic biosynthesis monooxygenase (ABM) superfamily enzyme